MNIRRVLYHTGHNVTVDLFVKKTSAVSVAFEDQSALVTGTNSGINFLNIIPNFAHQVWLFQN